MIGHIDMARYRRSLNEPVWHGCYDAGWKGLIADEAFAHPAKFSRNLIGRIYRHMIERGWLAPGMSVVDPFGGVALGALDAMVNGLHWVGVELEPKFHALGNANIVEWVRRYGHSAGWGSARLLNGDSRRLCEVVGGVDCVVSSPPYTESLQAVSDKKAASIKRAQIKYDRAHGKTSTTSYDMTPGASGMGGDYGSTPGQLGSMKPGTVDAVLSSPPYISGGHHPDQTGAWNTNGRGQGQGKDVAGYGSQLGQLGQMKPGTVDSVVGSPPFEGSIGNASEAPETKLVRPNLPSPDKVAAYLRERRLERGLTAKQVDEALGTVTLYSWYEGRPAGTQIPTPAHWLKLKSILGLDDRFDYGIMTVEETEATGRLTTGKTGHAKMTSYGASEGQLGAEFGDTFWHAAREIVQQCHAILRPGGVAAWVTKDFVRNKARVPFSADWLKLCESCGFELVEWVKASLVKDLGKSTDLYGDVHHRKVERKSFFRRLAEKKGSPRIDHEDVIFVRKKP